VVPPYFGRPVRPSTAGTAGPAAAGQRRLATGNSARRYPTPW